MYIIHVCVCMHMCTHVCTCGTSQHFKVSGFGFYCWEETP